MTNPWYKKIALPLIFVFVLPVVTAFCCCTEAAAEESPRAYLHCHSDHSSHQHSSKSSHDHSECNHGQIIADLAHETISHLASPNADFKIAKKDFSVKQTAISSKTNLSSPMGMGPPGRLLVTVPLYLQISLLRI